MGIKIKVIASSSEGNCYWLTDDKTSLLLECGIPIREIREAIGFQLSALGGCLISHEHGDHSKTIKGLLRAGVDCWMTPGTMTALGVTGSHRSHAARRLEQFRIGSWIIKPFRTVHNAADPVGYLLASTGEKVLFATDTAFIPHIFRGITHLLVECNYQEHVLYEGVLSGFISPGHKNRLLSSHMSLETLCKWLEANDLSRLKETWLLHASDDNSNAEEMRAIVSGITDKPTFVAEKRVRKEG